MFLVNALYSQGRMLMQQYSVALYTSHNPLSVPRMFLINWMGVKRTERVRKGHSEND